jgi:hypothetical protein
MGAWRRGFPEEPRPFLQQIPRPGPIALLVGKVSQGREREASPTYVTNPASDLQRLCQVSARFKKITPPQGEEAPHSDGITYFHGVADLAKDGLGLAQEPTHPRIIPLLHSQDSQVDAR